MAMIPRNELAHAASRSCSLDEAIDLQDPRMASRLGSIPWSPSGALDDASSDRVRARVDSLVAFGALDDAPAPWTC